MSRESSRSSGRRRSRIPLLWRAALAASTVGILAAVPGCPDGGGSRFAPPKLPPVRNPFGGGGGSPPSPIRIGGNGGDMATGALAKGLITPPKKEMSCDEAWAHLEKNKEMAGWATWATQNRQFSDEALSQDQEAQASAQLAGELPLDALKLLVKAGAVELADALPATPEIKKAQRKQVLVVGKFENDVTANNKRLDYALSELNDRLNEQTPITDNFVVVGMSEEAGAKAMKQAGAGEFFEFVDPLDPTALQGPTKYNPNTIYAVTGRMLETRDALKHRMQLLMSIKVTHSATRRSKVSREVSAEYRFHPARKEWVSAIEDDKVAAARGWKPKS